MIAIQISTVMGKDHQITVTSPDEVPEGEVHVELRVLDVPVNVEREQARAKLRAAGFLAEYTLEELGLSADTVLLTVEERMRLGELPPGAPPSEVLINEDRGER